jgi:hypothetical protein
MLVTSGLPTGPTGLIASAKETAKLLPPDFHRTVLEWRTVNGLKVLHLEMRGTSKGTRFVYCCNYYSNASGVFQLVTVSGENRWERNRGDAEALLNGITDNFP